MFIGYDFKATTKMNALVNGLLGWITYLDTMSMGKTPDFMNALNMMAKSLMECKKILNSGKKYPSLQSEFNDKSVGCV